MGVLRDLDETQAPLMDHLIELRGRLLRSVFVLAISFGVCFYFANDILAFLAQPLQDAFGEGEARLIYTKLPEVFFVELKVALFAAFCVSFPIIANQLWAFVAPGLYAREKRAFLPFLIATPILFSRRWARTRCRSGSSAWSHTPPTTRWCWMRIGTGSVRSRHSSSA